MPKTINNNFEALKNKLLFECEVIKFKVLLRVVYLKVKFEQLKNRGLIP